MKIVFLRHSKTLYAENESSRVLSPEGRVLARIKRRKHGNTEFDVILHSRKVRTRETALIYADRENEPNVQTHEIAQLWPLNYCSSAKIIDDAYGRFGNAGIRLYLDAYPDAMNEFATAATDALIPRFKHYAEQGMQNVLVVGHAIFTQAICANLLHGQELPSDLVDDTLGECEGYEFSFCFPCEFKLLGLLK